MEGSSLNQDGTESNAETFLEYLLPNKNESLHYTSAPRMSKQ